MRSRHSKQPILNGMRVWHLFFLLSIVAWSGSAALAGDSDCDDVDGRVLFQPHPAGHEKGTAYQRPKPGPRHQPGDLAEDVQLNLGTLFGLTGPSLTRIQLRTFGGCMQFPTLRRRSVREKDLVIYASRPTPIGSRAYLSIATEPDALGNKRQVVYLSADLGRYSIEVAPAGNPPTGPIRDYVARRTSRRHAASARERDTHEYQRLSREPGMPSARQMEAGWKKFGRHPSAWTDSGREIEIVVGYTLDVLSAASSSLATIRNKAQCGAQRFTDALDNNGISCSVRIVGYVNTFIDEAHIPDTGLGDTSKELLRMAYTNTRLRQRRRATKADLATMLVTHNQNSWGQGYVWRDRHRWFGYKAYSIVNYFHVAAAPALAHECAHNIGCGHETLGSTAQTLYAHGYFVPLSADEGLCTVMAYGPSGVSSDMLQVFSSPFHTWPTPMGDVALGTTSHNNNTRVIRRNLRRVANWGNQIWWITP